MAMIAVVGEVVADAVTADPSASETLQLTVHPGGSPANTALALSRLGTRARFGGRFGAGVLGRMCRDRLERSHVDLSVAIDVPEPQTMAIASLSADRAASYQFYVDGTADWGWSDDELQRLIEPADDDPSATPVALHTGSLALALDPPGPAIERLLDRGRSACTISIDPNVRPLLIGAEVYRAAIDRWAALADILRLSDDDLEILWPGTGPEQAADRLHDGGATLVVVTLGQDGVFASLRTATVKERLHVDPLPIEVADTVGAGDSFQAGMLHHLAESGALGGRLDGLTAETAQRAIAFGVRVAAINCSRPGADPPWAHELT